MGCTISQGGKTHHQVKYYKVVTVMKFAGNSVQNVKVQRNNLYLSVNFCHKNSMEIMFLKKENSIKNRSDNQICYKSMRGVILNNKKDKSLEIRDQIWLIAGFRQQSMNQNQSNKTLWWSSNL